MKRHQLPADNGASIYPPQFIVKMGCVPGRWFRARRHPRYADMGMLEIEPLDKRAEFDGERMPRELSEAHIDDAGWECYMDDYSSAWAHLDYSVQCLFSAELHTMDLAMGRGTPPVAGVVRR